MNFSSPQAAQPAEQRAVQPGLSLQLLEPYAHRNVGLEEFLKSRPLSLRSR